MELVQKVLEKQGDGVLLMQKGTDTKFSATLRWTSAVDLDLYCMYRLKATQAAPSTGLLNRIFGSSGGSTAKEEIISYKSKGNLGRAPWIKLDHDAGIGDLGGDNEENIHFADLSKLGGFIIVANIFNKSSSNFALYNGSVIVRGAGQEITVPLTATQPGSWCVVASVVCGNTGDPVLRNVNKTVRSRPTLSDYI